MKRHGNLFERVIDIDNIKHAHTKARKGKAFYKEVKMVDSDIDHYCAEIQKSLIDKTFTTSDYEITNRFDGRKYRTIYKLPYYPDRVVQHALLNVIGEILTASFIRDTFQSIIGRGTSDAMKRVRKLVRSDKCPKYALKIDIEKYYPSVNNSKLKEIIRRKIKCKDTLWLIDNIVDSTNGLPIGNYTSQIFGNLYLNKFDWIIKQQIKPIGYFRYCDDIVFMDNCKKRLIKIKKWCENYLLIRLGLRIKSTWNIYNIHKQGVDFVGYVFKKRQTKLRPSIASNFMRACNMLKNKPTKSQSNLSKIMAYKGWCSSCNAKMLWRKYTIPIRFIFNKQLRSSL